MAIVSDNCNVNRALERQVFSAFVASGSHRFNFAFQQIMQDRHNIISKRNDLMKRLEYLIPTAKLWQ